MFRVLFGLFVSGTIALSLIVFQAACGYNGVQFPVPGSVVSAPDGVGQSR
jgi:hypothetical protein